MEVSAVCTHPDFRGHGYAKALMLHVMNLILDNSFIPFLHVLTSNTGAIQLYESIGFRTRTKLFIEMIKSYENCRVELQDPEECDSSTGRVEGNRR
jgi:ribosomal protein S18 acetylase RimI-like enzyme